MDSQVNAHETVTRALDAHRGDRPVHIDINVDAKTARKISDVIAAELAGGALVYSQVEDLTTTQAALILGVSRPTLIKMLDRDDIKFHTAGTHKRIKAADLQAFIDEDRALMRQGIREINEIFEQATGHKAAG